MKFTHRLARRFQIHTAALRRLPDFLIIGAQKSGTTSLFGALADHPDVSAPIRKEVRYFSRCHSEGPSWYRSHFAFRNLSGRVITGEASTDYLWDWHAPLHAASLVPHAKIIAIIRDPVERAWSQYRMHCRDGLNMPSFEDALELEEQVALPLWQKRREDPTFYSDVFYLHSYKSRGHYYEQLERWNQYFSRNQMLVIFLSDFRRHPESEYDRVLSFLGLAEHHPHFERLNTSPSSAMKTHTRNELIEYFHEPNRRLFENLGRSAPWHTVKSVDTDAEVEKVVERKRVG